MDESTSGAGASLPPPTFAPPGAAAAPPLGGPADSGVQAGPPARSRRWILPVALVVVAAVAVGLVLVLTGGDDEDAEGDRVPATLLRLDDGRIEVYDESGEERGESYDLSDGGFPQILGGGQVVDGRAIEDGELRVVDVVTGTTEEFDVGADVDLVMRLGEQMYVAVSAGSTSGDAIVADARTGDADGVADVFDLDVRGWAPPVGHPEVGVVTLFAITETAAELTTAVVPDSGLDDAWLVSGRMFDIEAADLAFAGDYDDGTSTLRFTGPDGDVGEEAEVDGLVVGGLAVAAEAGLVVVDDGSLLRFDAGSGEVEELRSLDLGEIEQAYPLGADRLLVRGEDATALLDDEGEELGRWDGDADGAPVLASVGTRCVSLMPPSAGATDAGGVLVDLGSGETLAELDGRVFTTSADGCSFVVITLDADQVVVDGAEVDLGAERVMGIDPVGQRALIRADDAFALVDLDGEVIAELDDGIWLLVP